MNVVCLLDNPEVVIASGKRVFSAQETGALLSLSESADRLQASAQDQEAKLQTLKEDACARGHKEGLATGLQLAKIETAQSLLTLSQQASDERAQLREQVLALALEVVRKIADGVADDAMLYALATSAAQTCLPSQTMVLKVHPDVLDAVKKRLANHDTDTDTPQRIEQVIGDADLDTNACVLETESGAVCADLELQLSVIEKHLTGSTELAHNAQIDGSDTCAAVQ